MNTFNGRNYDFNNQSDRADFRTLTGGFIDDSGAYAPGSGQRLGDTWSGANAGRNVRPNDVFLPIHNGTPMSPSSARTGGTDYANGTVGRDDDLFSLLFGPNSYFGQQGGASHYGWMNQGDMPWTAAAMRSIQGLGHA